MRNTIVAALFTIATSASLSAGSINVVHLGPPDVLKFEVTAGDANQDFTLSHGTESGPFMLPEKPASIKGFIEGIPPLDIPVSDAPRIAILATGADGFTWHLMEAKPSPKKWAFRIVNLSPDPVQAQSGETKFELSAGAETSVNVTKKSQLNLRISDSVDLAYKGNEPRGIVVFIYRNNDQWHAICLPDR